MGNYRTLMVDITSPNRAGVAEPRLKIWDKNSGQTDRQTDKPRYRVAL